MVRWACAVKGLQRGRFQENRTPDNLFQGLCQPPFGDRHSCSTTPTEHQYNVCTTGWLEKNSLTGATAPEPVPLENTYDLGHGHPAFLNMYDGGKMDGAGDIPCIPEPDPCPITPQFKFVDNSTGILDPYLELATQYGWANYMFQTNQGPSFPAHQFIFGGTRRPMPSTMLLASSRQKTCLERRPTRTRQAASLRKGHSPRWLCRAGRTRLSIHASNI
jgi:hypothetical protein